MYYYLKQQEIDSPSCQNIKFKSLIQFIPYTFIYSYHTSSHASCITQSYAPSHLSMPINITISNYFQLYFIIFDCIASLFVTSHTPYSVYQLSLFAPSHFPIWHSVMELLKLVHTSWTVLFHCRQSHSLGSLISFSALHTNQVLFSISFWSPLQGVSNHLYQLQNHNTSLVTTSFFHSKSIKFLNFPIHFISMTALLRQVEQAFHSKIKFENEVTIKQVFLSRRLVIDSLTRLTG